MMCNWESFLRLVPFRMREAVDEKGRKGLQELRFRRNLPPELVLGSESIWLEDKVKQDDLIYCLNAASRFSPWTARSMARGYLTAEGGHRIGICGEAAGCSLREITSVCIRVARDFPGIAKGIPINGSVVILGAPGWGKTTLLRDVIRCRGQREAVAVVDERGELFPKGFSMGLRTDVMTGVTKKDGILQLLRTMGPKCIAVDEITEHDDCDALCQAAGCGVELLTTAHAGSLEEFRSRPVYSPLANGKLFDTCVILCPDKSYRTERMAL